MRFCASMSFSIAGIILISLLGLNSGQELSHAEKMHLPVNFRNEFESRAMVSRCRPNNDKNCYLAEAIQYVVLGNKDRGPIFDSLFNSNESDSQTLDDILGLGLHQLGGILLDEDAPKPGEIETKGAVKQIPLSESLFLRRFRIHIPRRCGHRRALTREWLHGSHVVRFKVLHTAFRHSAECGQTYRVQSA